jgi:hypothetical protein
MSAWAIARALALGVTIASGVLAGCSVQDGQGGSYSGYSGGGTAPSGSAGSSSSSSGSSGGATTPMLVDVDTNRTMTASPGDGVGVFTQYAAGGHWNIWWTCDTHKTSESCSFDVTVSVSTGSITNVAGQTLGSSDAISEDSAQQIEVQTTTTTTVQGVTFDTVVPAGTLPIITLDAKLSGVADPSYLFFVQDDSINGDYPGMLTDPLMLEPSSP